MTLKDNDDKAQDSGGYDGDDRDNSVEQVIDTFSSEILPLFFLYM